MSETFPRQFAITRRFTLGAPRDFTITKDGSRVVFLRSQGGRDPITCLWVMDVQSGVETLLVDPSKLDDAGTAEDIPAAERARRERARESASGIVSFAVGGTDDTMVSFVVGGRPCYVDITTGDITRHSSGEAFDARIDPSGIRTAFVRGSALWVWNHDGGQSAPLIGEETDNVSWGSAEFVAGEEMGRTRGYWWAPDGRSMLVARVDVSPVQTWYLGDPTNPAVEPLRLRYPAAGTANAMVDLAIVGLDGSRLDIDWRRNQWEYLANVSWSKDDGLHLVVQSRDQRHWALIGVDAKSGTTEIVHEIVDETWVELVDGSPSWWGESLVTVAEHDGTRQLFVGHSAVSGPQMWVRRVVGNYLGGIVFTASVEPTEVQVVPMDARRCGTAHVRTRSARCRRRWRRHPDEVRDAAKLRPIFVDQFGPQHTSDQRSERTSGLRARGRVDVVGTQ